MKSLMDIEISIQPEKNYIHIRVRMGLDIREGYPCFYLNRNMTIHSCTINGIDIPYEHNREGKRLDFIDGHPFSLKHTSGEIELVYSGTFTDKILHANCINENLVEISSVSAFYPVCVDNDQIESFKLLLRMPPEYVVVTNGILTGKESSDTGTTYRYVNLDVDPEIMIVASREMKKIEDTSGISAYYCSDDFKKNALVKIEQCGKILDFFREAFGPLVVSPDLRYIIVPRSGFGYTPSPCIVITEQREAKLDTKDRWMNYMLSHEISHCYWRLVGDYKNNGWIDEALADYSALIYLKTLLDEQSLTVFFRKFYIERANDARSNESIVMTHKSSADRMQNWYGKAAATLFAAGMKFGFGPVNSLASHLYSEFNSGTGLDSGLFFERAALHLDKQAFEFVEHLYKKQGWNKDDLEIIEKYTNS